MPAAAAAGAASAGRPPGHFVKKIPALCRRGDHAGGDGEESVGDLLRVSLSPFL
jgi:hypothetical protein